MFLPVNFIYLIINVKTANNTGKDLPLSKQETESSRPLTSC